MLVIFNLSYALPNGQVLFSNLSFSCQPGVTALIGRNGIGKSSLLHSIAQQRSDTRCLMHTQEASDAASTSRVIDALRLGHYYDALQRTMAGQPREEDIEQLEHHWDVIDRANAWLAQAELVLELEQPLVSLSGGQRTKVQLLGLIKQQPEVLLLDEPSNHLDQPSTLWLINQLKHIPSTVLLASHDALLLNHFNQFLVLDEQGIHPYQTDFTNLRQSIKRKREHTLHTIHQAKAQLKKAHLDQQIREQKAQRRQRQGEAKRDSGSQSKMLIDKKKEQAQTQNGAQTRLASQRSQALKDTIIAQQHQLTGRSSLSLQLPQQSKGQRRLLNILAGVLPYGDQHPITLSLNRGQRLRLKGKNGSGKSTLIHCIQGVLALKSGELTRHGNPLYLDQHLSLLDQFPSAFDLFEDHLPELDQSTLRTLLGTIGLHGDKVFQPSHSLSGGERMKVALMLISQLPSDGLLILDETDNHLDLDSQDQLAFTLDQYQGALIFVTHQEHWIRTDKTLELSPTHRLDNSDKEQLNK